MKNLLWKVKKFFRSIRACYKMFRQRLMCIRMRDETHYVNKPRYDELRNQLEAAIQHKHTLLIDATGERQIGKTTMLLRLASKYNLLLFEPNSRLREYTRGIDRGIHSDHVMVIQDVHILRGSPELRRKVVLVDEMVTPDVLKYLHRYAAAVVGFEYIPKWGD